MVFDHPKPNPYSELLFPLNFLCALSFTQFVEKLYIGVPEGSISPSKSLCTVGVRLKQSYNAVMYLAPMLRVQAVSLRVQILKIFFFALKSTLKGLKHIYIKKKLGPKMPKIH